VADENERQLRTLKHLLALFYSQLSTSAYLCLRAVAVQSFKQIRTLSKQSLDKGAPSVWAIHIFPYVCPKHNVIG